MPAPFMKEMLDNSLCFALHELPSEAQAATFATAAPDAATPRKFIGFARCVTDFTTFSYLSDVWISPDAQGLGLGSWMIACVQETIESLPFLRRSMLFTGDWERSVPFYRKLMKVELMEVRQGKGPAVMEAKGPGNPWYNRAYTPITAKKADGEDSKSE
jgi:ribosomal protein S18 acetylase RimI-like enzyme